MKDGEYQVTVTGTQKTNQNKPMVLYEGYYMVHVVPGTRVILTLEELVSPEQSELDTE